MTDVPSPESLMPGSLVGPWRIEGYAGRGSYGLVFRARLASQPHSPLVALKLAFFPGDPRFRREGSLLERFQHPAMPRLLDQGLWRSSTGTEHPYLAMEWLNGLPMYNWARYYSISPRQALLVVAQVADALALLHQAEALHRDVKGDNILVDAQGRAVLTDFGSGTWKGAPPLTESLMPPNTPEYRSPEARRFHWRHWDTQGARYEATAADDIYALGVTAYRLVTRLYPPPGTSPEELKQRLQAPPARRSPALAHNARVGPEFSALIERMLAQAPKARASADEVAREGMATARQLGSEADGLLLPMDRPALAVHAVPAPAVPVAEPPRAFTERSRTAVAVRSSLITLVVVLTVMLILPSSQPPYPERPMVMPVEAPDEGGAPDGGTRGLGDDALAARVEIPRIPLAAKALSLDLPKEPVPGQRRPPCDRKGAKVIQGGCWILLAEVEPPCGHNEYEWQGACYAPMIDRTRPPTSEQPEQ